MIQAIGERLWPEQHRERHGHRAQLQNRQQRHGGLNALRQADRDAVAALESECCECRGETIDAAREFGVVDCIKRARVVLPTNGSFSGTRGISRPFVCAGSGDVELCWHIPPPVTVVRCILVDRFHAGARYQNSAIFRATRRMALWKSLRELTQRPSCQPAGRCFYG